MESTLARVGVIHGRFQVLHNDHLKYILAGKARCNHLVIGITNPDPMLTKPDDADPRRSDPSANPMTYDERAVMIREVLLEVGLSENEFSVVPFPINFPELYEKYVPLDAVFYLTIYDDWGRRKKEMFEDLNLSIEILWEKPVIDKGIHGADIRRAMVDGEPWEMLIPPAAARLMKKWNIPVRLKSS